MSCVGRETESDFLQRLAKNATPSPIFDCQGSSPNATMKETDLPLPPCSPHPNSSSGAGFKGETWPESDEPLRKTQEQHPRVARGKGSASTATNVQSWQSSTRSRLQKARTLRSEADGAIMRCTMELRDFQKRGEKSGNEVQGTLRKKIEVTEELTRQLMNGVEGAEDVLRLLNHSLFGLQRALACTVGPLQVVEARLKLREGRPLHECTCDAFQEALESERDKLVSAQGTFKERIENTHKVMTLFENLKARMYDDMHRKRHANRLDHVPLISRVDEALVQHPPMHGSAETQSVEDDISSSPSSSLPPVVMRDDVAGCESTATFVPLVGDGNSDALACQTGSAGVSEGRKNEQCSPGGTSQRNNVAVAKSETANWKSATLSLSSKVQSRDRDARKYVSDSETVTQMIRYEISQASAVTNARMRERMKETLLLKREIDRELKEMNAYILGLEQNLAETERQRNLQKMPMQQCDRISTLRSRRAATERIRDSVSAAREEHVDVTLQTVHNLSEQFARQRSVLDGMISTKKELMQDLQNKLVAWKIDDQCSKITMKDPAVSVRPASADGRTYAQSQRRACRLNGQVCALTTREGVMTSAR